jgi:hypothetical protein
MAISRASSMSPEALFIVAAEWRGMPEMVPPGTGRVLTTRVDVPEAGWP